MLHENNQLRGENVGELESLNAKVNTLMSELATAQELAQKSNEFDKTHKQVIFYFYRSSLFECFLPTVYFSQLINSMRKLMYHNERMKD